MKYITCLLIIVLMISCKHDVNNYDVHEGKESRRQGNSLPFQFPFGQDTASMKTDSLNEFGAGDCWGNIRSISNTEYSIIIDTTNCGDYGFYLNFYLFNKGRFLIAQQFEADFMTLDEQYIVTHNIFDFRNAPFEHLQKIDTGHYPFANYTSNRPFSNMPIENHQTIYERILTDIERPWKMRIDY